MKTAEIKITSNKYKLTNQQKLEIVEKINKREKNSYPVEFTFPDRIKVTTTELENIFAFIESACIKDENIWLSIKYVDLPNAYGIIDNEADFNWYLKLIEILGINENKLQTIQNIHFANACYVLPKGMEDEI